MLKLFRPLLAQTSSSSLSLSPSPYSRLIAKCSTSPSVLTESHAHINPRNVRVTVFWDVNDCAVPPGVDPFGVAPSITAALEASGIYGPIKIQAFADMSLLSKTNKWALNNTAISFTWVPAVGNYSAQALSNHLNDWALQNPAPGHIFLISSNTVFAKDLSLRREERYNILLASKDISILCNSASIWWSWDYLVRGENLTGRYFNQPPPDSGYDHYEGLLEKPSTVTVRPVILDMNWCDDSFWRKMEKLISSDIGTFILSESKTRANLVYYLQKYGPSVPKSVTESELLLMVDQLITDKKLVQETAYLLKPFLIAEEAEKKFAHARDMEKEIVKLNKRLKNLEREKKENKQEIDELKSKLENSQKINEERESQLRKTEQALKVAQEEIMKAKFDATSN